MTQLINKEASEKALLLFFCSDINKYCRPGAKKNEKYTFRHSFLSAGRPGKKKEYASQALPHTSYAKRRKNGEKEQFFTFATQFIYLL